MNKETYLQTPNAETKLALANIEGKQSCRRKLGFQEDDLENDVFDPRATDYMMTDAYHFNRRAPFRATVGATPMTKNNNSDQLNLFRLPPPAVYSKFSLPDLHHSRRGGGRYELID